MAMCGIRYAFLCGLAYVKKKAGRKPLYGLILLVAGQGEENMKKIELLKRRKVRSQRIGICKKPLRGGSAAR